jgi:hypothetical protein
MRNLGSMPHIFSETAWDIVNEEYSRGSPGPHDWHVAPVESGEDEVNVEAIFLGQERGIALGAAGLAGRWVTSQDSEILRRAVEVPPLESSGKIFAGHG